MRRRRLHRLTFLAAGIYNICWGCYAAVDPQWLFRLTGMPPSNTPEIFATLGMVLGLYGILYLEVARVPERGWLTAAVGLTGKVLGPLGLAWLIFTGRWPPGTVIITMTNDLLWWIPFARYLYDARPGWGRTQRESGCRAGRDRGVHHVEPRPGDQGTSRPGCGTPTAATDMISSRREARTGDGSAVRTEPGAAPAGAT